MKIGIIGGGAAGLCAAIAAARGNGNVTIFERNDRVGKKILMTGNGKCNLSNLEMSAEYYYSGDRSFVARVLERFGTDETILFFNGLGLLLTEKRGGIYPHSEQASAVLDALRFEADSLGINICSPAFVKKITKEGDGFEITFEQTLPEGKSACKKERFDRVIIAAGGKAAPKTGSDGNGYKLAGDFGIKMSNTFPALCGVRCRGKFWKEIAGVRCQASLLIENEESGEGFSYGELQITDYGISGIPVFQISRLIAGKLLKDEDCIIDIDLFPDVSEDVLFNEISSRVILLTDRTSLQILGGFLNKKLAMFILKSLGIRADDRLGEDRLPLIVSALKHLRVMATEVNSFEQAQTTAGGVLLSELDDTLQSRNHKGLFFAGEILDADGVCGGYNLQWAWSTGYIAGEAAALC
ncbi:MAG: aminoacetone oxidase family FAD-binding enzyme [Lachnospiraceae bacterium]|nr:aminoacetone oxidase family FAD-binding enzyme [Lachnospiraceae bacterium]